MRSKAIALLVSAATFTVLAGAPSEAQQTTGAPGSPDATTTIDGHVLPPPPSKFGGDIELNAAQSKAYWLVSCRPRARRRDWTQYTDVSAANPGKMR
jgi:hypothetical protein